MNVQLSARLSILLILAFICSSLGIPNSPETYAGDETVPYVYVTDGPYIRAIDISNPASPIEAKNRSSRTGVPYRNLFLQRNIAYTIDQACLEGIGIPTLGYNSRFYCDNPPAVGYDVYVVSYPELSMDYAYVPSELGLTVFYIDGSDIGIRRVESLDGKMGSAIDIAGQYAYVTADDTLFVLDISNPNRPEWPAIVGRYQTPTKIQLGVEVAGSHAYVSLGDNGMRVVNVSNSAQPIEVGEYTSERVASIQVVNDYAFAAAGNGVRIFNISNPSVPTKVGSVDAPGVPNDIAVSGSFAYLAAQNGGLRIIDTSNVSQPIEVGVFLPAEPQFSFKHIAVQEGDAAIYSISGEIRDISNRPLSNIEIVISTGSIIRTDENGSFTIGNLIAGTYIITPTSTDYTFSPASLTVTVPLSQSNQIFRATPTKFSIFGEVTDVNDQAIDNVTLTYGNGLTTTTNTSGFYAIHNLSPGEYIITPSKEGYTFSPSSTKIYGPPNRSEINFKGYNKPPLVFVHGWSGIPSIFGDSCRLPDPKSYFASVDDDLRKAGYYVAYAQLETSFCKTPSLKVNIPHLVEAINQAKTATGQSKVILITHSMGGLVSRAYIENENIYKKDVEAIFTFGSPHLGIPSDLIAFLANGIPIGKFCKDYQSAICDMSLFSMTIFNFQHTKQDDIKYYMISGDAPPWSRNAFGIIMDHLILGPDDGITPLASGLMLTRGDIHRWTTDEVHFSGFGSQSYFTRNGGVSVSYTNCLEKILIQKQETCDNSNGLLVRQNEGDISAEHTPFLQGALSAGQVVTHSISIENGPTLFATTWQTGTTTVRLIDPTGQLVDSSYAISHPDIVTFEQSPNTSAYYFPNTVGGQWHLIVDNSNNSLENKYTAFASFDTSLKLVTNLDRLWHKTSATATITATLTVPVTNATAYATYTRSDGVYETLTLEDHGSGNFSGTFPVPDTSGHSQVKVTAIGINQDGNAFERGKSLIFQIASSNASFNGFYTDTAQLRSPVSLSSTALTVTVGINSLIDGDFSLSADLVDSEGNYVAHALATNTLVAGNNFFALRFEGNDIYNSRRDGPYILTNVVLTEQQGAILIVDEVKGVYTTSKYDHLMFSANYLLLPIVKRE